MKATRIAAASESFKDLRSAGEARKELRSAAEARKDLRLQLLDDTWLLTIFAVLLAVALPWIASGFDVDVGTAFWGALVLAAIHLALSADAWTTRISAAWRKRMLAILHSIGVVVIGVIWHHAGGLQNPVFLLAFALPVIGASFISRWQPHLTALLAILVVAFVALAQAPELRWYLGSLGDAGARLAALFTAGDDPVTPFSGFYAPYGFSVVLLEVFAVLLFACAVASEYLRTVFERLRTQVEAARVQAAEGQELWMTMMQHLPAPALLVDADTLDVVGASEHLVPGFCEPGKPLTGKPLADTVEFSYPEVVEELVKGAGGSAQAGMVRAGNHLRAVTVNVSHVAHRGHRFALVVLEDLTGQFCAHAALDAAEYAVLVVDPQGRIVAFNKPARELFAGTQFGMALQLLADPRPQAPWWNPGLTGRRKMHVHVAGRIYQVTSTAVPLPGEDQSFHVIAFHPTARVSGDRPAPEATPPTDTLVELS